MLLKSIIYAVFSGLLFFLASPTIGIWPISFIAFVPLLIATENQFNQQNTSFLKIYFIGFTFSYIAAISCFYWIANMSWLAMVAATTIYAIVYGLFVPGVILGYKAKLRKIALSLWIVFLWISLETLLSDLILPIPSMAIGYFIWPFSSIIQISDITGVTGVSVLIITSNVVFFSLIKHGLRKSLSFMVLAILMTCLLGGYGYINSTQKLSTEGPFFSINTIYTSILSKEKNNKASILEIFEVLKQETSQSISTAVHAPDLIVWPETSVPIFLRSVSDKEFITELLNLTKKNNTPLLLGARAFSRGKEDILKKYNSAFLVPAKGFISQEYHKNFLAPFVETNPLREILPSQFQWLSESKFDAGKEPGIIHMLNKTNFGIVICYEIFFPNFVRKSAGKHSGFLVNITNDQHAFGKLRSAYKIPLPHLIFRAVENHKYLVRSANWGYSVIITPSGKILKSSKIGSTGYLSAQIIPNYQETFFSKHGFIFAKSLLTLTAFWAILLFRKV